MDDYHRKAIGIAVAFSMPATFGLNSQNAMIL